MSRSIRVLSVVLAVLGALALYSAVLAQEADLDLETFTVAIAQYDTGNYHESAELFQQLVDRGYNDPVLLYNLGNAHYRDGDYGQAILAYRRGILQTPRDNAFHTNLDMARERVIDQLNRDDLNFLESLTQLDNWITLTEMALVALGLWIAWACVRLFYRRPKSERQRTALQSTLIGLTIALVLVTAALGYRLYLDETRPAAVVLAAEVDVLDAPALGQSIFVLHNGAEVHIVEQQGGWVKLTLPGDALQGWVSTDQLALISP